MLSKLASEKFNNPSAKIDWNLVPWGDWQAYLPKYLVKAILKTRYSDWQAVAKEFSYTLDCNYVAFARLYHAIERAYNEGYIIEEQANFFKAKYFYAHINKISEQNKTNMQKIA